MTIIWNSVENCTVSFVIDTEATLQYIQPYVITVRYLTFSVNATSQYRAAPQSMVNEMMHGGGGGGGSVAAKPLNNFKRLSASLETLISSIAQDWETAATVESAEVTTAGEENRPIHGQLRKAQLLFTGLHSATRQTHVAIEGFRLVVPEVL